MKLSELFNPNEFAARHLSFGDEAALLEALGEKSMDDLSAILCRKASVCRPNSTCPEP